MQSMKKSCQESGVECSEDAFLKPPSEFSGSKCRCLRKLVAVVLIHQPYFPAMKTSMPKGNKGSRTPRLHLWPFVEGWYAKCPLSVVICHWCGWHSAVTQERGLLPISS